MLLRKGNYHGWKYHSPKRHLPLRVLKGSKPKGSCKHLLWRHRPAHGQVTTQGHSLRSRGLTLAKTLYWDCETAPALVYTFSFFKTFIGLDQVVEHPRMLGFSYLWEGQKRAKWVSEFDHTEGRDGMLKELHALLDEADIVVTYNGKKFDAKWAEGEFLVEGMTPPSPYHHVDLYREIRAHSAFPSGKLDYAAWRLLDDRKVHHAGFSMWKGCMDGDEKAWREMAKYAKKDTELLPPLHDILRPYIKSHPSIPLLDNNESMACPKCGSDHVTRRGYLTTAVSKFQRFQCQDCGGWFRGSRRVGTTEGRNA